MGSTVAGMRAPDTLALAFTVGLRAALARPTWAWAARDRASTAAKPGLCCRASAIRASSCASPSFVHQSVAGQASASCGTPARLCVTCSEEGSVRDCCGRRPPRSAQPAKVTVRAAIAAMYDTRMVWPGAKKSGFFPQRIQDAFQQLAQLGALSRCQRRLGAAHDALAATPQLLPQILAGIGQFDAQGAPVLLVRAPAQVALAFQLVELAGHGAAVEIHRTRQFSCRHRPQLGQPLEDQELVEAQFGTAHRQLGLHGAQDLAAHEAKQHAKVLVGRSLELWRGEHGRPFYCRSFNCQGKYIRRFTCTSAWPARPCRPTARVPFGMFVYRRCGRTMR